jgi:hypothetical protein
VVVETALETVNQRNVVVLGDMRKDMEFGDELLDRSAVLTKAGNLELGGRMGVWISEIVLDLA